MNFFTSSTEEIVPSFQNVFEGIHQQQVCDFHL